MKTYDVIIVGAGIVGLAAGLKILESSPSLKILFLEKEDAVAKHQTGNNSGVIHSGIYYKPGSLKAKNCVRGYQMLLEFCDANGIEYDICGKIITTVSAAEVSVMKSIYERGLANGLKDLKILSREQLKEKEPFANGISAISVPQTGIINYTTVSNKYLENSLKLGAEIQYNSNVVNLKVTETNCQVVTNNAAYSAKVVVTCAGLQSDRIAKITHPNLPYRLIPFRGEYFKIKKEKRHLVNNLIYPVPDPSFPFLGVHFTRMINGEVECGPNAVLSFKREGYNKTSFNLRDTFETFTWRGFHKIMGKHFKTGMGEFYRSYYKSAFVKALQRLLPEIKSEDLEKGGAGVRAQACMDDGKLLDDFYIVEDKRVVHVCNAPSPAATASLAIGEHISQVVIKQLN